MPLLWGFEFTWKPFPQQFPWHMPSSCPPFLFSFTAPPHLSSSSSTTTTSSSHICHLLLFVKAGSVLGGWWITHIGGLNQIKLQVNYTNKPIKCHSKSNFHSIPHIYCKSCFLITLPSLVPSLALSLFLSLSLLPLSSSPPDPLSLSLHQVCLQFSFTHLPHCTPRFSNLGFKLRPRQLVGWKEQ